MHVQYYRMGCLRPGPRRKVCGIGWRWYWLCSGVVSGGVWLWERRVQARVVMGEGNTGCVVEYESSPFQAVVGTRPAGTFSVSLFPRVVAWDTFR